MFDKDFFSRMLKVKRAERGWTQADLSKNSGISVEAIASYESKRTCPSFASVVSLAKAFGCSTDEMYVDD